MTNYYIRVPWDEPRYAQALESKPGNRVATHHTVAYIRPGLPPGTRLNEKGLAVRDSSIAVDRNASFEFAQRSVKLTGYAPGQGYKRYPKGAGRVLPPDRYFTLNQHYQPTGKPETDQSELGSWFHDDPIDTDVREIVASDGSAVIEGRELVAEQSWDEMFNPSSSTASRRRHRRKAAPTTDRWSPERSVKGREHGRPPPFSWSAWASPACYHVPPSHGLPSRGSSPSPWCRRLPPPDRSSNTGSSSSPPTPPTSG